MLEPGLTVGGLLVEEQLGEDQLAATWRVREVASGRARVLRLLTVHSPPFQERFLRAARTQLSLQHPNLVQVVGLVEIDGLPGVVTEFVEGGSLLQWMAGEHGAAEVFGVFVGLLRGVGAAHAIGMLHRNLKPSKVLMATGSGAPLPKVNDFTLGKVTASEGQALTQVGVTFGTPHYMAPEQFRGVGDVDPRADLFALGVVLFEMLARRRLFEGTNVLDVYRAVSGPRPSLHALRPDLPRGVERVVAALLDPDPALRPDSTKAVLARMREDPEVAALLPVAARTPTLYPAGPTIMPGSLPPEVDSVPPPPPVARPAELPTMPPAPVEKRREPTPASLSRTLPPEKVFVPDDASDRLLVRLSLAVSVLALVALALLAALLALMP